MFSGGQASLGAACAVAMAAAILPNAARADAWTPERGAGALRVTAFVGAAEDGYDRRGERLSGTFDKREIAASWEHGLSDRIAAVGRVAFQDAAITNVNGDTRAAAGFGAGEAGLRLRLTPAGRWAAAVEGGLAARGKADTLFEVREIADAEDDLGAYAGAAIGRGFGGADFGGWFEAAADVRRLGDREETRAGLVLGVRPSPRCALSARLDAARWSGDAESRKAALALEQRLGRGFALEATAWRALGGKNAYVEDGLAAALVLAY